MVVGTEIVMWYKGWGASGKKRKLLQSEEAKRKTRMTENTRCLRQTERTTPEHDLQIHF